MEEYVEQASEFGSQDGQAWTLVGIALILGLGKGGVPGFATVATAATVVTAPQGALGLAVGLQVPILSMIDIAAAFLHKDVLDWSTVWLLLPFSLVGMILGVAVQTYVWKDNDAAARLFVGLILLGILVLRTYQPIGDFIQSKLARAPTKHDRWHHLIHKDSSLEDVEHGHTYHDITANAATNNTTKQPQQQRLVWAIVVGIVGGAATMLTNSMGPILNVYLLSIRQLTPSSYIGTRAMFFLLFEHWQNSFACGFRNFGMEDDTPRLEIGVGVCGGSLWGQTHHVELVRENLCGFGIGRGGLCGSTAGLHRIAVANSTVV